MSSEIDTGRSPWVHARQAQLEADLVRAWRNDPIAQAEMLAENAPSDNGDVQMAATYPRHEMAQARTDERKEVLSGEPGGSRTRDHRIKRGKPRLARDMPGYVLRHLANRP